MKKTRVVKEGKLKLLIDETEELIISEISNRTNLILPKNVLEVKLKAHENHIIGNVFLFDEYYGNFNIKVSEEQLKEKICKLVFLIFAEFGELDGVLTSGRRNALETKLESTTIKINSIINSKINSLSDLGNTTIMVDELYPYGQTDENNFPLLQYEIRDSNMILNLSFELIDGFLKIDEEKVIKKVISELIKLENENTRHKR